ncbi:MAG TPA: hypothetical protein VIF12_01570, partial [Micavibrio sp.]
MSIMTRIFGQNAKGENGLQAFGRIFKESLKNENFRISEDLPNNTYTHLAFHAVSGAIAIGAIAFAGTLAYNFFNEAPALLDNTGSNSLWGSAIGIVLVL